MAKWVTWALYSHTWDVISIAYGGSDSFLVSPGLLHFNPLRFCRFHSALSDTFLLSWTTQIFFWIKGQILAPFALPSVCWLKGGKSHCGWAAISPFGGEHWCGFALSLDCSQRAAWGKMNPSQRLQELSSIIIPMGQERPKEEDLAFLACLQSSLVFLVLFSLSQSGISFGSLGSRRKHFCIITSWKSCALRTHFTAAFGSLNSEITLLQLNCLV